MSLQVSVHAITAVAHNCIRVPAQVDPNASTGFHENNVECPALHHTGEMTVSPADGQDAIPVAPNHSDRRKFALLVSPNRHISRGVWVP